MADFALWATACETALWSAGTFWSAYCGNRDEAIESVIDADPIASAVRALMVMRTEWTGTASELLGALGELAGERVAKSKIWPDSPRALAGRLRRAATFLRKIGVEIAFEREGRARTRIIHVISTGKPIGPENLGARPSLSSAPSSNSREASQLNGFAAPGMRTVGDSADGPNGCVSSTVRDNSLRTREETDADSVDGNFPPESALKSAGWSARI